MKTYGILCFVLALFMILTPLLSLDYSSFSLSNVKSTFQKENDGKDEEKLLDEKSDSVKIKSAASGNVATASTKEYIIGCVAAEMPATYSTEALKAQAVCAYTNLVRLKKNPDSSLSGADISDDPGRHQGYYDIETQKEKWGDKYDEYRAKTEEAVTDVLGKTIVFNGEPIVAAYCAISPGRTESAENIWGGKIEYLVSVTSPGDKLSPDCIKEISLSADEVREYTKNDPEIVLGDDQSGWITDIVYTDSGSGVVKSLKLGGKSFTGNSFRALFSLRSPAFTLEQKDGAFFFKTYGYGHSVGMSQYGADYMAKQGSTYEEILAHYYPNTEII